MMTILKKLKTFQKKLKRTKKTHRMIIKIMSLREGASLLKVLDHKILQHKKDELNL